MNPTTRNAQALGYTQALGYIRSGEQSLREVFRNPASDVGPQADRVP